MITTEADTPPRSNLNLQPLYLRHHLNLAGRSDTLFSDDSVALIHQTSRGYPRAVNNLALQALVAAFADDKSIVDESSARTAIAEVTAE
jgi:type II secretory pathway predicted ATPase ExeA